MKRAAHSPPWNSPVLPFSEPVADSNRVHVGVALAGVVAADLRVAIPAGPGEHVAAEVVHRPGADQQAGPRIGGIADGDRAGVRARLQVGAGARNTSLAVHRPALPQRQDADARQRERVRVVLAADRVGCRARRRGAVVEFAQASVSAFEGEVAVEEIADAEAEAGVAALVAARGADALVGERVVEVAAAKAEAAAAEVDAAVPGAVDALGANHAGADRECDRRACNDGFLVHPCSFSVVVSASAPGEGSIAALCVKAGHHRVKLSKKKARHLGRRRTRRGGCYWGELNAGYASAALTAVSLA